MKTIGTIIGRIPLTETSLILQWCTADRGLIKTVAKGARRPKSPFAGKIDLFFFAELEIHPAKTGELHILKDLAVVNSRLGLRTKYNQTLAASYFVKLVLKAAEPETPITEIDDLLNRGLDYLAGNDVDLNAIRHFEKQLAQLLGLVEPEREPVDALYELLGGIPKQREELLKRIDGLQG